MFTEETRPLILVTNDDGYDAPGIRHLTESLRGLGRLVVVAPDAPRSGFACSFTATSPIVLRRLSDDGDVLIYSCSGTPVDCVKLALHHLFAHRRPDLIVSGINHGGNDSVCVIYSGTMGAVLEGCVVGIPAVGFSLLDFSREADFTAACPYVRSIAGKVLSAGLPYGMVLNVNIPARPDLQGVRVARQADGYWCKEFELLHTAADETVFRVAGEYANREPQSVDTDRYCLERGYVTVVPQQVDLTAYRMVEHCREMFEGMELPGSDFCQTL